MKIKTPRAMTGLLLVTALGASGLSFAGSRDSIELPPIPSATAPHSLSCAPASSQVAYGELKELPPIPYAYAPHAIVGDQETQFANAQTPATVDAQPMLCGKDMGKTNG